MNNLKRPRVLLADDHRVVAEGLSRLLSSESELVGVVEYGRALVDAATTLHPDVTVAEVSMPHLNGIDALVQLRQLDARVRGVVLTMHTEVSYACRALEAGALGYVLKPSASAELITAVRAALEGKTYFTPSLAGEVLEAVEHDPQQTSDPLALLTTRQRETLQLLAEGRSAKVVEADLGVSARTAEFHIPDDGKAGYSYQRRAGSLRHQARHRGHLICGPQSHGDPTESRVW